MQWVEAREAKVLEAVSAAAVYFLDECIRALLHFHFGRVEAYEAGCKV